MSFDTGFQVFDTLHCHIIGKALIPGVGGREPSCSRLCRRG